MGLSVALVSMLLKSPIYDLLLVPAARGTMVSTAEKNGIDWRGALSWIQSAMAPLIPVEVVPRTPAYYRAPFHAYPDGNLCWDAAMEQELAGKAVGIRNFPTRQGGNEGERLFRESLEVGLRALRVEVADGAVLVDFGCGTGTSTRRLAQLFPQAARVIGVDLSPHMVAVGRHLLKGAGDRGAGEWIEPVTPDARVELLLADIACTGLPDACADLVSMCLVLHELPPDAARDAFAEAFRVLRPGGVLWCAEMDGSSPGYRELRQNPALFALIRATEPYLDQYFDSQEGLIAAVTREAGFSRVEASAATGRHFNVLARKPSAAPPGEPGFKLRDLRFDAEGRYAKQDTHLHTLDTDGHKM